MHFIYRCVSKLLPIVRVKLASTIPIFVVLPTIDRQEGKRMDQTYTSTFFPAQVYISATLKLFDN